MSEAVTLCQKLISFKSTDNNCRDALEFFKVWLSEQGFSVRLLTYTSAAGHQVDNLYAKIGSGHPHLLFSGHMDVVDAGDAAAWKHPPFAAQVDAEMLYGRGVADMKGGIACFAAACKEFVQSHKFNGAISFVISCDEEEPLVNGTLRVLEQLTAEGEKFDFCLVGEPSNPQKIGEEIKVGRRGDVVLKLTAHGQQGHTAYPHLADNPLHHLTELLHKMIATPLDEGNEFFGPSTLQITTIDTGNKASNIIPAEARAQIDVRFNSLHTSASIIDWTKQLIAETAGRFSLETEVVGESFLSPIGADVAKLASAVTQITGRKPAYSTGGGTSDARFVKDFCPVVEFGLTNATIHKVNEAESLENIDRLYEIYRQFLINYFL